MSSDEEDIDLNEDTASQLETITDDGNDLMDIEGKIKQNLKKSPPCFFMYIYIHYSYRSPSFNPEFTCSNIITTTKPTKHKTT